MVWVSTSLVGIIIVALLPTREAKVAPKKVELTEEQLEDKKKRFEKAQKEKHDQSKQYKSSGHTSPA